MELVGPLFSHRVITREMLRPAKLFASFHQFRHYLHCRVTELVRPATNIQQSISHASGHEPKYLLQTLQQQQQHQQHQQSIASLKHSTPLHRPVSLYFSKPPPQWQQFRSIVSCSTHSGTPGPFSCGLPRTATVSYGRVPFASRQFSTGRPCWGMHPPQTNSVFSYVPSRIFSPVTRISPPREQTEVCSRKREKKESPDSYRVFSHETKGISELVHYSSSSKPGLVHRDVVARRGSDPKRTFQTTIRVLESSVKAKIPMLCSLDTMLGSSLGDASEGSLERSIRNALESPLGSKGPPDATNRLRGMCAPDSSIYLSISLDSSSFWQEALTEPLLSLERVASLGRDYQVHLDDVFDLLQHLQQHGDFKSTIVGSQLKLFFPTSLLGPFPTKERVHHWLRSIHIEPESHGIEIIEQAKSEQVLETMGPEYFRGIQQFLDHVDDLIETSAAFVRQPPFQSTENI
ncbi:hypothetical protein BDF14DRAFT_1751240 [Spinellus fusiger]|nr:hypothetical protein BDF14DRAFT_1751240 [Spinellus fusiger]